MYRISSTDIRLLKCRWKKKQIVNGYTLLELSVTVVIITILATQLIFSLSSHTAKVKGVAFNMKCDFNLARSEAVERCRNVLIDFVKSGAISDDGETYKSDGYRICIDNDNDSNCDSGDALIKEVFFGEVVQFYDTELSSQGGPGKKIDNVSVLLPADGIHFTANRFAMKPNGTSNKAGTVYIYVPEPVGSAPGTATGINAVPFAVVVAKTTGRVRLLRWSKESQSWGSK